MEVSEIVNILIAILLSVICFVLVFTGYQFYKISLLVRTLLGDLRYTTKFIKSSGYAIQTGFLKTIIGLIGGKLKGGDSYEERRQ